MIIPLIMLRIAIIVTPVGLDDIGTCGVEVHKNVLERD
jgi:hypothetical protein